MDQTQSYKNRPKPIPTQVGMAKGILCLIIGTAVLLHQLPATRFLMPEWLYGPHTLVMLIGLYKGIKSNFNTSSWLLLIMLGIIIYLVRVDYIHTSDAVLYGLPAYLIVAGAYLILKK
jgi:hypothetical protein